MPVEVIDEKSNAAVILHPMQLLCKFVVGKMVAKKRGKNNIRFFRKLNVAVIVQDEISGRKLFFGKFQASRVDINSGAGYIHVMHRSEIADHPKVVRPSTSYLANM